MAIEILELGRIRPQWSMGATELLELGSISLGSSSPVLDLFKMVEYMENPAAGILTDEDSPQERAIADKMRKLARLQRKNLLSESGVAGYSMGEISAESMHLVRALNGIVLGKKKKSFFKKIHGKILKVVKSPAFLSVAGLVVNVIPGVGQIASVALMAAAASRKAYEAKVTQKKATKKMKAEEAAAAKEAATADQAQIDAYYGQYGPTYLAPIGYTPEVWGKLTTPQKRDVLTKLSEGTLQPYVDPNAGRKQMVDTVAMDLAMKKVYGNQLKGDGLDLSKLPPDVVADAQKQAPAIVDQINTVGKDNFMATAVKAVGQAGAIGEVYAGSGAAMPPEVSGAVALLEKGGGDIKKAIAAGEQDLLNSAAADGSAGAIGAAMDNGSLSSFPYVPVIAGVAGTAILGIVLWKVL